MNRLSENFIACSNHPYFRRFDNTSFEIFHTVIRVSRVRLCQNYSSIVLVAYKNGVINRKTGCSKRNQLSEQDRKSELTIFFSIIRATLRFRTIPLFDSLYSNSAYDYCILVLRLTNVFSMISVSFFLCYLLSHNA